LPSGRGFSVMPACSVPWDEAMLLSQPDFGLLAPVLRQVFGASIGRCMVYCHHDPVVSGLLAKRGAVNGGIGAVHIRPQDSQAPGQLAPKSLWRMRSRALISLWERITSGGEPQLLSTGCGQEPVSAHRNHSVLGAVRDEEPLAAKQLGTGTMRVNWVMMTVNRLLANCDASNYAIAAVRTWSQASSKRGHLSAVYSRLFCTSSAQYV
jgi:hypothetical protein